MKIQQMLLKLCCVLTVSGLWSQTKPSNVLTNSSVYEYVQLSGKLSATAKEGVFDSEHTRCIGGQTKLYYSFSPSSSLKLGARTTLKYSTKNYSDASDLKTSYNIYGPFNQTDDFAEMVVTNNAPVLESGSTNTGERVFSSNVIAGKTYIVEVIAESCDGRVYWQTEGVFDTKNNWCEDCLPKFVLTEKQFVVSAWVKEETASGNGAVTYTNTQLKVNGLTTLTPSGQIIDGWQRVEGIVTGGVFKIECIATSGTSYFDDIRIFPYDGTMVTYVYDPATLRLSAELDERNYAKIYEYDEEGKLVRIKKETEKGIMTIQENRENSSTTAPGY